jgi:hypothetical protein
LETRKASRNHQQWVVVVAALALAVGIAVMVSTMGQEQGPPSIRSPSILAVIEQDSPLRALAPNATAVPAANIGLNLPRHIAKADWDDLWSSFKCTKFFSTTQPNRNQTSWMLLRGMYLGLMLATGEMNATTSRNKVSSMMDDTGIQVPHSVRQVKHKGRGIFAEAYIPKGALIYTSLHGGHARFTRGIDFKTFVYSVPREMACEVLQCSAVESFTGSDNKEDSVITVSLDSGCYMNTVNDDEKPNAGCPRSGDKKSCLDNDYALRHIHAGEEILCDYSEFANSEGWEWFALRR